MSAARRVAEAGLTAMTSARDSKESNANNDALARFMADLERKFQLGDELRAWDDAERRFHGSLPNEQIVDAVRSLSNDDLSWLLEVLSSADSITVHTIMRFVSWSQDLGRRWLAIRSSRAILAMGVLRCLHHDLPPGPAREPDVQFGANLEIIAVGLATQQRGDELALWWQILALGKRLCDGRTAAGRARWNTLFETATASLARVEGADLLSSFDDCRSGSGSRDAEIATVLPRVALRTASHRKAIVDHFLEDVIVRLENEAYEMLELSRGANALYLDSCGLAIAMKCRESTPPVWWSMNIDTFIGRVSGWRADLSDVAFERAAWLSCAAAIAILKLADDRERAWRDLAESLFARVESRILDWSWTMSPTSSARRALPELLVRVALLDVSSAERRIRKVFEAVPDALMMNVIQKSISSLGSSSLERHIASAIANREKYEAEMGIAPRELLRA